MATSSFATTFNSKNCKKKIPSDVGFDGFKCGIASLRMQTGTLMKEFVLFSGFSVWTSIVRCLISHRPNHENLKHSLLNRYKKRTEVVLRYTQMRRWPDIVVVGGIVLLLLNTYNLQVHQIIIKHIQYNNDGGVMALSDQRESGSRGFLRPSESFGACMMMKEDNVLLYEWIAYHYIMMPLRYLVIGSDIGNRQDPRDVLRRWDGTGLRYWVINGTDFANRHGEIKARRENDHTAHHHQFLDRQRAFVTTCAEHMKRQNMSWIMYTDSDEFVVINRFESDDSVLHNKTLESNETIVRYRMRQTLSQWEPKEHTVLDAIRLLGNKVEELGSCVVMPRLRFGALENQTCGPESEGVNTIAKEHFRFPELSTLRYKIHGGKENFEANKYGKVLVDLSRLSNEEVTQWPKNVHRPFKKHCPKPIVWYREALFTLNHYTASWERYSARHDLRRTCKAWREMAFYSAGNSCEQNIHRWFPRFTKRFGTKKARFLLGVETQNTGGVDPCLPQA